MDHITALLEILGEIKDNGFSWDDRYDAIIAKASLAIRDAAPSDAIQLVNAIASLCRSYIQVEGDAWSCGANDMAVKVLELIAASAPREKTSKLVQIEPSLTRCAAARDGECFHAQCPQTKDGEPEKSGRHCPIDNWGNDD